MARHARIISNSGIYHIMVRGINKEQIFKKDFYKTKTLEILKDIKKETDFSIISYCVMDNHLHLLIKITEDNLAVVMKKLNVKYAMFYNRLEKRYGYVFQDRFKSEAVEDDKYLLGALRYIHNNPVKARITDNIVNYHWCSMKEYMSGNLSLISEKYLQEILGLFKDKYEFLKFHNLYDDNLYLDTKEEQEVNIQLIVQNSIEKYAIRNGFSDQSQFSLDRKEELAKELMSLNLITYKEVARLCNLPYLSVLNMVND
ncbi:MAG: transposase [Sedimentibacter sp.]